MKSASLVTAILYLFVAASSCAPSSAAKVASAAAATEARIVYPETKKEPVTETYFGVTRVDPYRWLEEATPETKAWLEAQNALTGRTLEGVEKIRELQAELTELNSSQREYLRAKTANGKIFAVLRDAGADVPALVVRDPKNNSERLLLTLAGSRFTSIDFFRVAPDGRHILYGASSNGRENSSLHVLRVSDCAEIDEPLQDVRYAQPQWLPDGSGYFYARDDRVKAPSERRSVENLTVYTHRIGTRHADDRSVFSAGGIDGPPMDAAYLPTAYAPWGSGLVYAMGHDGLGGGIVLASKPAVEASNRKQPWATLTSRDHKVVSFALGSHEAFLLSRKDAPLGAVLRVAHGQNVLSDAHIEGLPGNLLIEDIAAAADGLFLYGSEGGLSHLYFVPEGQKLAKEISLGEPTAIHEIDASPASPGVVVRTESWTRQSDVVFCGSSGECTSSSARDRAKGSDIAVSREVVVGRDGTRIPLTLMTSAGAASRRARPTILFAYGSHGVSIVPNYLAMREAWLRRGGTIAFAHVRGGGELGEAWHEAGKGPNKPKSIADFIDCAEWMIRQNYTSTSKLAAHGGSAGGLVVYNAILQRPELFRAAFLEVAIADLVRFETTIGGLQNAAEFGSAKTREGFEALSRVDPYEHVVPGTRYPAILISAGVNDPRVPAWQAAKMAARMQSATTSGLPVLLMVDFQGGHGVGATSQQQVDTRRAMYGFFLWQLGEVKGPEAVE